MEPAKISAAVQTNGTVTFGVSRATVREIDRRAMTELGLPGLVLMENAGRNVVDLLENRNLSGRIGIVCGKGNNGGDGFVIARHLALRGRECRVLLCVDESELTFDAAVNYAVLRTSNVPVEFAGRLITVGDLPGWFAQVDVIVDALLGTGATGSPRGHLPLVITALNASGKPVVAVDLPSGMDADTGERPAECVRADITATFVGRKLGFGAPGATDLTGDIIVLPIGVTAQWLERTLQGMGVANQEMDKAV